MRTALDAPGDILDEGERRFVGEIRTHGWFRTSVFADAQGPGFSYTTGLWVSVRHPELIVFGLSDSTAHAVFWDVFRNIQDGHSVEVGTRTDGIFGNAAAYALPVASKHYEDYLGWSRWFYAGNDFPCLLIVWPDAANAFPWEASFDASFLTAQTDLTEDGWGARPSS
ncbi:DUF4262 domain-containing protein [Labrys sp. WJW]|uniref:DUF4262 domain-containing protein n=1 Tax=Labrys sp. WJW TaxID=1737983 RepID=UPI0009EE2D90|nr:DUF4262 domain-containing protein [Labrys sp. WJW]